jgi:hypothetical protein
VRWCDLTAKAVLSVLEPLVAVLVAERERAVRRDCAVELLAAEKWAEVNALCKQWTAS